MTKKYTYRKDYQPPQYRVPHCALHFGIFEDFVEVTSQLTLTRNPDLPPGPCRLQGQDLELLHIELDGQPLSPDHYERTEEELILFSVPEEFVLHTTVRINPYQNQSLEGLYASGEILCSQNEATGFRRITYHPDRPDVRTRFQTCISAERDRFPVLLSNGNLIRRTELEGGRHSVQWDTGSAISSYLFAVVAGDLDCLEDQYSTGRGRRIDLKIYTDKGRTRYAVHAMDSLKQAMRWDETNFGREYDLDLYMIVAVDSFNSGAMENKGLNIFNSSLVFASADTATDADYENIANVVAHEYFHNWTGNRITCRDWFQLTLKEGLTVYRDQLFSEELSGRAVQRIEQVSYLRDNQYAEDAGPNRHPIRPDQFLDISNFYTNTVYEKGAAVIRMIAAHTGRDGFRKGMDCYFERFDGQAVTCEDFLDAIEQGSQKDLTALRRWYSQAGTPEVSVEQDWNPRTGQLRYRLHQQNPQAGPDAPPLGFPFPIAVYNVQGRKLAEKSCLITERSQVIEFGVLPGQTSAPVPSLMPDHVSPLEVRYDYSDDELFCLMRFDEDPFNRYDATQNYLKRLLLGETEPDRPLDPDLIGHFRGLLGGPIDDPAYWSQLLIPPSLQVLADAQIHDLSKNPAERYPDYQALFQKRERFKRQVASALQPDLLRQYNALEQREYRRDRQAIGKRGLRNTILGLLACLGTEPGHELSWSQYRASQNMDDSYRALQLLAFYPGKHTAEALQDFLERWKDHFLIVCRWFGLQAGVPDRETLGRIPELARHELFQSENPNMIRSLYHGLGRNLPVFHDPSGTGYRLLTEQVLRVDPFNSSIAANMAKYFSSYQYQNPTAKAQMREQLETILRTGSVSKRTYEIVSNTLEEKTEDEPQP